MGGRGIVKEKSDDDEIPNYITELNTVIASKGISSNTETLPKTAISSQSKSIIIFQNKFLWRYND